MHGKRDLTSVCLLMGLITDALIGVVREAVSEEKAVAFTHEQLAALRDRMAKDTTEDARDLAQKAARRDS